MLSPKITSSILAIILFLGFQCNHPKTVYHIAKKTKRPAGAPKYSDVSFSSRWHRPLDENDPHDTFETAAAFFATRLDWVYSTDSAWITECKSRGYHFVSSLNSKLPDSPGGESRLKGRIVDRDGNPVTAPWMKDWKAWWGCANTPEYRNIFMDHAKICIDGSADYFQIDDPDMNYNAVNWGGCFCKHCREKAKKLGVDLDDPEQMKKFQAESVTEFFREIRKQINDYAGRHVPLSCNNYLAEWTRFPYAQFKIGMAEVPEEEARPELIYKKLLETRRLGKAQLITFVSEDNRLTRKMIATIYACGANPIVPWDVYLKSTPEGSIRFFGEPKVFADLYGFVRANANYFDGYEDACIFGHGLTERRFGNASPLTIEGGSGDVYAFVRVKPGENNSPIIIHLIEWANSSQSFRIKFKKDTFFNRRILKANLHSPVYYDTELFEQSARDRDYSRLSRKTELNIIETDKYAMIDVSNVDSWAIVVLTPEN